MNTEAPQTAAGDDFVSYAGRNNFYQTCAFIPMSFALVTTVHENGETGIGPHALIMPFGISPPYSMLLISRAIALLPTISATPENVRSTILNSTVTGSPPFHALAIRASRWRRSRRPCLSRCCLHPL